MTLTREMAKIIAAGIACGYDSGQGYHNDDAELRIWQTIGIFFPDILTDYSFLPQVEEHGHKLPYREGDQVRHKDGRVGVLIHKEWLRFDADLDRDIWQLVVQYGAFRENYTNPSVLSVPTTKQRLTPRKWADPVA